MTRTATTITATDVPEGCTVEAVFVVDAGAGTGPAWQVSTALADDQRVDLGDDLMRDLMLDAAHLGGVDLGSAALVDASHLGRGNSFHLPLAAQVGLELGKDA